MTYLARETTEATRARLRDIFQGWKIGWYASKNEDGYIFIHVAKRQFDRVGFKLEVKDGPGREA